MSLTPAGAACIGQIYARQVAWSTRVVGQLKDEELLGLVQAIRAIGDIAAANGATDEGDGARGKKKGRPRRQQ